MYLSNAFAQTTAGVVSHNFWRPYHHKGRNGSHAPPFEFLLVACTLSVLWTEDCDGGGAALGICKLSGLFFEKPLLYYLPSCCITFHLTPNPYWPPCAGRALTAVVLTTRYVVKNARRHVRKHTAVGKEA